MNMILRKLLFFLCTASFILSFLSSFYCGNNLLNCFFRASLTLLFVGFIGGGIIKVVFRNIAVNIAEYEERKKKEKDENAKKQEEKDVDLDNDGEDGQLGETEEHIAEQILNGITSDERQS